MEAAEQVRPREKEVNVCECVPWVMVEVPEARPRHVRVVLKNVVKDL